MKLTIIKTQPLITMRLFLPLAASLLFFLPNLSTGQTSPNLSQLIFEGVLITADGLASNDSPSIDSALLPSTGQNQDLDLVDTDQGNMEDSLANNIQQYEAALLDLEAEDGPFASGLSEQLEALGSIYQQSGEFDKAIEAFKEAQHVLRVNNGLFTLDQVQLIEKIIESYSALNDIDASDDYHEFLYYIQTKNFADGDSELIAASKALADWNIQAYFKEPNAQRSTLTALDGIRPYTTATNNFVAVRNPGSNTYRYVAVNNPQGANTAAAITQYALSSGANSNVQGQVHPRLRKARKLYESILDASPDLTDDNDEQNLDTSLILENLELQEHIANVSYIVKQQIGNIRTGGTDRGGLGYNRVFQAASPTSAMVNRGYIKGKEALEEAISALQLAEASTDSIVEAQLSLADWHLSFDRTQRANKAYEEAYSLLLEAGKTNTEINATMSPKPALSIPTFATHMYSRALWGIDDEETLIYQGYIDVQFSQNRRGNLRNINVLGSSANTPNQARSILLSHLRNQRVRPAFTAGETKEQNDITVRYYYTY